MVQASPALAVEAPAATPLLSLRGVTKRFPGLVANDNIDLDVYGGQVHAVLGENGAGKSTLMKVVYGFYHPEAGTISVEGKEERIASPKDSRRLGIGMVFQNFALVQAMTVAENIALFSPSQPFWLSKKALERRIRDVSARYALHVDPSARVDTLSMGERQKVELVKLILARARVLICDEPTSVLAPHEVDGLFRIFTELKADGYAVIFITHKLNEVLACADQVTVLRRGSVVASVPRKEVTVASLVNMMFGGAELAPGATEQNGRARFSARPASPGTAALEFRDVVTATTGHGMGLDRVSFQVMPGEVLGVAGVSGNGQAELGELLLRMRREEKGSVMVFGEEVSGWGPARVIDAGVGYVPEDVVAMGSVPEMRVDENLVLGDVQKHSPRLALDWPALHRQVAGTLTTFPLKLPDAAKQVRDLSGGNVQRVVLARELARRPRLLVAYYPTRGLDISSAVAIRRLLLTARDDGAAILLISEDLDELLSMSDRLIVMFRGRIAGRFVPSEATVQEIGLLMTGAAPHPAISE
jgi:simple sugar transport system ATP-binding protein